MQLQDEMQFDKFIRNGSYVNSSEFNLDNRSLMKLVRYAQKMEPSPENFDVIKKLIKFYRIPILIAFESFYKKLNENYTDNVAKYEIQIKQIASLVKSYLDNYKLDELNFYYMLGTGKKKKLLEKSQQQIEFIVYIEELGKDIMKLKKTSKDMNPEDLKLELDSLLSRSLNRKMNALEKNYEQYFKKQADKIYNENRKKIESQLQTKANQKKTLEQKPDVQQQFSQHICCRRFFYDRETIKQPQNLVLQYKNYQFPFDETRTLILKKTLCAFLNTNGGIIFLGIYENVDTKMRKVIGMQLNESEKQKLLISIRKIAQCIEPDIISNRMYNIEFVPVKVSSPPYNYISGRYLAKIIVKYGIRDQIYSYRHDNKEYFSFRTQNEVVHKEGRQVLNAYRQRIKNPLPEPNPLHPGPCLTPEKGSEIYQARKQSANFESYTQLSDFNDPKKENYGKIKYKEKDAIDYIIFNIKQKELSRAFRQKQLMSFVDIRPDENYSTLLLKVVDSKSREAIITLLKSYEIQNKLQLFKVERGFSVKEDIREYVHDILKNKEMAFYFDRDQNIFKMNSSSDAVQIFLSVLLIYKIKGQFVQV